MPEKNFNEQSTPASSPIAADNQESFPFYVWSGLLTPEHRKKMGISIWVFEWCINRTTHERDGLGFVLGGSRIRVNRLAQELGVSERSVKTDLARLRKHGYLKIRRIPYGLVITVPNSKRWTGKRSAETCPSEIGRNLPISIDRSAETRTAEVQDPALIKDKAVGVSSKRRVSSSSASPHRSSPKPEGPSERSNFEVSEDLYA
jgi:predicted DNA-binding transcriptional regulator